jgi:hypothetical protein
LDIRLDLLGEIHPQSSLSFEGVVACALEAKDLKRSDSFLRRWEKVCRQHQLTVHALTVKVLRVRLNFAQKPDASGIERFLELLTNLQEPEKRAEIHWEAACMLRELGLPDDEHRNEASKLYRELYAKSPKIEYKKRI